MLLALVATVLAILAAQVLPVVHWRQRALAWWPHWLGLLGRQSAWGWLLALALPLLLLGLLQWLLHGLLFGVPEVLFSVLVLVLCAMADTTASRKRSRLGRPVSRSQ